MIYLVLILVGLVIGYYLTGLVIVHNEAARLSVEIEREAVRQ